MINTKKWRFNLFLIVVVLCLSCKDTKETKSSTTIIENPPQDSLQAKPEPTVTTVYSWVSRLRLREQADTKSPVVKELSEGEALIFTGNQTNFKQKITLRGKSFNEPWLQVTTSDGITGWVYGGGVHFHKPSIDASPTPYDKCLQLLFKNQLKKHNTCTMDVQMQQLKKDKAIIRKTNTGHEYKLLDGSIKKLPNINTILDSTYTHYHYRWYIPNMGFYVFKKETMPGGNSYALVNDKSGVMRETLAFPKPAPNGKYAVLLFLGRDADPFLGYQIWGFTDNGFQEILSETTENYIPTNSKWIDDKTLDIQLSPLEDDGFYTSKTLRLHEQEGQWVKAN